ncbi:SDR family oxidoreductase [Microbacterium sp. NPDC079995]|uniref:SDR family oxidoreductase n=1 Tax=unclassified Microbacterium TaxID=2609290 RepID=UPI00344C00F0
MPSLTDSVVLITGANGGLGQAFVAEALERGASKVYATARTPREWTDARVQALPLDINSADSIEHVANQTRDVTIVVNNAGVAGAQQPVLQTSLDDMRSLFETNVFAQVAVTQAFAPILQRNGGGSFVNIHSAVSWLGTGDYAATKAAFWSLSNALRLELLEQGTHLVGAHLGYTDTPFIAGLDVPKNDPGDVVAAIYDGLENGEYEVLADDTSRQIKHALSGPLTALYPRLEAANLSN